MGRGSLVSGAPSELSQRDLRSVTCHCNRTVPASLKSLNTQLRAVIPAPLLARALLLPVPFTPAAKMAHTFACNACGRHFTSDAGLWKHLRSSRQPECQAELQRVLHSEVFLVFIQKVQLGQGILFI